MPEFVDCGSNLPTGNVDTGNLVQFVQKYIHKKYSLTGSILVPRSSPMTMCIWRDIEIENSVDKVFVILISSCTLKVDNFSSRKVF